MFTHEPISTSRLTGGRTEERLDSPSNKELYGGEGGVWKVHWLEGSK